MRKRLGVALLCLSLMVWVPAACFGDRENTVLSEPIYTVETIAPTVQPTARATAAPMTATSKPTAVPDTEERSLRLDQFDLQLALGGKSRAELAASLVPPVPANLRVSYNWSSSAPDVATVSDTGERATVTALQSGVAVITVTASSPSWPQDLQAECTVRVTCPVRSINLSTGLLTLRADGGAQAEGKLAYAVEPSNHTETIAWRVDQVGEVISFDEGSGKVLALSPGSAQIVALSSGGMSALCKVVVRAPEATEQPPSTATPSPAPPRITYAPYTGLPRTLIDRSMPVPDFPELQSGSTVGAPTAEPHADAPTATPRADAQTELGTKTDTEPEAKPEVEPTSAPTSAPVPADTPRPSILRFDAEGAVVGIRVNGEAVSLRASLTVFDPSVQDDQLVWKSGDKRVAKIDEQGILLPGKIGKTTITVTAPNGDFAVSQVIIYKRAALSFRIGTKPPVTLEPGETLQPSIIYSPMHSYAKLRWSSSDTAVATVDPGTGFVTAVGKGTVRVIAQSEKPDGEAALSVKVVVPATALSMYKDADCDDSVWAALPGQSRILGVIPVPDWDTTSDTIKWSSSNARIASVNKETGEVKALKPGNAVITARTTSGVKASCAVKVLRPAESISLSDSQALLHVGEQHTLKPTLRPKNSIEQLSWTSSDPAVATVSEAGEVTAIARGEAVITVTTCEGLIVRCMITVLSQDVE